MNDQNSDFELGRKTRRLFLNATCFVFLFIFYASLLPYNITSTPVDMSISGFLSVLQFSSDGAEQGQWIGHVIFTALLTFLASIYCGLTRQKHIWFLAYGFIIAFGVLIEYFQMFVGSRGTSSSDIYANFAGMAFGYLAWVLFGKFSVKAVHRFLRDQTLPVRYVRKIYLAFVVAVILFPFDFFINGLQLQIAFATKGMPLFENTMDQGIGTISLLAAMILTFPLGVLYRLSSRKRRRRQKNIVLKFGMFFLFLEVLQFFEISGQSSLLSFLCKFVGFSAGFYLGKLINLRELLEFVIKARKFILFFLIIFIGITLKIKGFSLGFPPSLSNIMAVIESTSFLPFQYYIDVGSGEALLSFLLNFVIFIPIGGYMAIHYVASDREYNPTFSRLMRIGILLSILFEVAVLIWGLKRPDITNVLVSAFALPMGYYIVVMIVNGLMSRDKTKGVAIINNND